jgi:hypothetical protein
VSALAFRPDVEDHVRVRVRVGLAMCAAAVETLRGTPETAEVAMDWLLGVHPGWEGLYAELPHEVHDRMERAAGDLALAMPGADIIAAETLALAEAWLTEVTG